MGMISFKCEMGQRVQIPELVDPQGVTEGTVCGLSLSEAGRTYALVRYNAGGLLEETWIREQGVMPCGE